LSWKESFILQVKYRYERILLETLNSQKTPSFNFKRSKNFLNSLLKIASLLRFSKLPGTRAQMAAGGSSSSQEKPEKLMKGLQLEGNSSQMEKLELDMREEVRRFDFIEFANLNLSCVYANIYIIVSLFNARFKTLKQKYESYRFEGDPNEVGHVVTTRCTTREDASDVR